MFLHHARVDQVAAAYLLFTVALLMVPKADVPETPFDEGSTQTNEMVVVKAAFSLERSQSVTAPVPAVVAQSRKIGVRGILPVYAGQLTDCRALRELCCTLLC